MNGEFQYISHHEWMMLMTNKVIKRNKKKENDEKGVVLSLFGAIH